MSLPYTPRIFVRCLQAHRQGKLHGCWMEASTDVAAMQSQVDAMLASCPVANATDWEIVDAEGFGSGVDHPSDSLQRIADLVVFLNTHGELGQSVLGYYAGELEVCYQAMELYIGERPSLAEYLQNQLEKMFDLPDLIKPFVDYKALAQHMEAIDQFFALPAKKESVHIFLTPHRKDFAPLED